MERTATEVRDTTAGFEFEYQPEHGGLARALGTEQRRDRTGTGLEGQIVHGGREVSTGVLVSPMAWSIASLAGR